MLVDTTEWYIFSFIKIIKENLYDNKICSKFDNKILLNHILLSYIYRISQLIVIK